MNEKQFDALLEALSDIAMELSCIRGNLEDINWSLSHPEEIYGSPLSPEEIKRAGKVGLYHRAPSALPEEE